MMPFSPIRMLILGLLSWTILGVGIYLAFDVYHELEQSREVPNRQVQAHDVVTGTVADVALDVTEREVLPNETPIHRLSTWFWTKVLLIALCVGISACGRLPVRLIFMQSNEPSVPVSMPSGEPFLVVRPCGSQIRGTVFGPANKPALVLTHGWSLDSSAWKYVLPALTERYRIVVWDLPGLGESRGPSNRDYSIEKMADDLAAVIDRTCAEAPVVLVGHSIGGMILQTFCRRHSESLTKSVKGIVLLHTTYTNPVNTNVAAPVAKPLEPLISLLNLSMIPLAPVYWLSNWQSYWNGSAHVAARFESFTGRQTWEQLDSSAKKGAAAWPSVIARGNFGMQKFNEQANLAELKVPSLVIGGKHDRLTVPEASQRIADLLPQDRLVFNDGGHLGYWEFNNLVAEAIMSFAGSVFKTN